MREGKRARQAVLRCWECRFPRWNSPTSGIQGRHSSTLAREYRGVSPGVVATGVERRAAEPLRRALRGGHPARCAVQNEVAMSLRPFIPILYVG